MQQTTLHLLDIAISDIGKAMGLLCSAWKVYCGCTLMMADDLEKLENLEMAGNFEILEKSGRFIMYIQYFWNYNLEA